MVTTGWLLQREEIVVRELRGGVGGGGETRAREPPRLIAHHHVATRMLGSQVGGHGGTSAIHPNTRKGRTRGETSRADQHGVRLHGAVAAESTQDCRREGVLNVPRMVCRCSRNLVVRVSVPVGLVSAGVAAAIKVLPRISLVKLGAGWTVSAGQGVHNAIACGVVRDPGQRLVQLDELVCRGESSVDGYTPVLPTHSVGPV